MTSLVLHILLKRVKLEVARSRSKQPTFCNFYIDKVHCTYKQDRYCGSYFLTGIPMVRFPIIGIDMSTYQP